MSAPVVTQQYATGMLVCGTRRLLRCRERVQSIGNYALRLPFPGKEHTTGWRLLIRVIDVSLVCQLQSCIALDLVPGYLVIVLLGT